MPVISVYPTPALLSTSVISVYNIPVLDGYVRLECVEKLFPQSLSLQIDSLLQGEPAERKHPGHTKSNKHKQQIIQSHTVLSVLQQYPVYCS